jgi:hypothetical protein
MCEVAPRVSEFVAQITERPEVLNPRICTTLRASIYLYISDVEHLKPSQEIIGRGVCNLQTPEVSLSPNPVDFIKILALNSRNRDLTCLRNCAGGAIRQFN